jgi:hypothetical protein
MAWQTHNPHSLVSVILLLVLCLSGFALDAVHASVDCTFWQNLDLERR